MSEYREPSARPDEPEAAAPRPPSLPPERYVIGKFPAIGRFAVVGVVLVPLLVAAAFVPGPLSFVVAGGAVALAFGAWTILRPEEVRLHRARRVLEVGAQPHGLDDVTSATVEDAGEDSAFMALVLVGARGSRRVATGNLRDVQRVADAVNRALPTLSYGGGSVAFQGFEAASREDRAAMVEAFLRSLPLDEIRVTARDKGHPGAAAGRFRGHRVEVTLPARRGGPLAVTFAVPARIERMHLEHAPGTSAVDALAVAQEVLADDAAARAAFGEMPMPLQRAVVALFTEEGARHVRVRKDGTTFAGRTDVQAFGDPVAHATRVLTALADVVDYFAG